MTEEITGHKIVDLTYDIMFLEIFEQNKWALKKMLSSVLNLNLSDKSKIKIISRRLPVTYYREYGKTVDIFVIIDDKLYINVEMNRNNFKYYRLRNYMYLNKIYSLALKRGDSIKTLQKKTYIQLNLNVSDEDDYGEKIVYPYEITKKKKYLDNYVVYLEKLDYYYKLYYNDDVIKREKDYWLAALKAKTSEELRDILSNVLTKKEVEILVRRIEEMSAKDLILTEEEERNLNSLITESIKEEGRQEGIEQGIEQGRAESISSTIQNMLNDGVNLSLISKYTGASTEYIMSLR